MVAKQIKRIVKVGYSIDLFPDNIMHLIFDGTAKVDLNKAKEIRDDVLMLSKGEKFRGILDFRGVSGVTTLESRQFMSKEENFNNLKICDAFVTVSYTTSILIGIYIKLFTPNTPTKAFSNLDDALTWIKYFPSA